ncbi:MAG TPA: type IX secretion system sortase PorU [Bacteroidia bacterium]|nr:type IX secretion system sortase PorU [Bacteroidia bacterium]
MHKIKFLTGFFIFLSYFSSKAADPKKQFNVQWNEPSVTVFEDESTLKSLHFKNSIPDENFNPQFFISEALPSGTRSINVTLKNVITEVIADKSYIKHSETISNEFKISATVAYKKKQPYSSILILSIRKNSSGQFERLKSFELDMTTSSGTLNRTASRVYAPNSVLANGEWYKFGVTQDGVCKIDYTFLKNMGIDVDSIDPRQIQIYGNGGGMLAFLNSTPRIDDLRENAIFVQGESDSKFDSTDYILFYGTSQTKWSYNDSLAYYKRQINYYADTTYYFLTYGQATGKRIPTRSSVSGANTFSTSFDDYAYHEIEGVNFLKSGREWFGESMDNLNNSFTFNINSPNIIGTDTVFMRSAFAGRSANSTNNKFSVYINNSLIGDTNYPMVGTTAQDNYASLVGFNRTFFSSNPVFKVTVSMYSSDPSAQGWLNYIELIYRRGLTLSNTTGQLIFRDSKSIGSSNITEFTISNAGGTTKSVWDVSDPANVTEQQFSLSGSNLTFSTPTPSLKTFVLFDNTMFSTPRAVGIIENQNLHALPPTTYLIVTNPLFLNVANELADFHRQRENMSVTVVTTQQVFNEFSSGAQDVSAIRDFSKMFYDRATSASELPKYLLLFGDASYDNKYRVAANSNFVTSYQSAGSINQTQTYISDDFFALLDDSEGEWYNNEIVDMSVGRIPVATVAEANQHLNKIKNYVNGGSPVMNNWRNIVSFVGDDQDYNIHFRQSDTLANRVRTNYPNFNVEKIYFDAYQQDATPGGQRYPEVKKAINERVQRGTLLMTYIGHGGELGWAHERVLENDDINSWTNTNKLAAFLTATCEFTRVDDPDRVSAGEYVFLNPSGGSICMFTTSRLAYSSSNFNLCTRFFNHIFERVNGEYQTTGDIFEKTKSDMYVDPYVRNFLYLGDPAIKLAYPEFSVKTKTINGIPLGMNTDTLKALSKITITGEVQDNSGAKMSSFNGIIYPTVYDKMASYSTLGNDINDPKSPSTPQPFTLQKNVIYSGKSSVVNGDFTYSFYVPKDIAYQYGNGKLSYYAQNGQIDANGCDTLVTIGGVNPNATVDNEGPVIRLYLNDENFVRGGMTNKDPILYAVISDTSGVNTVGTGIGHDMSAELDNKTDRRYILNDYYENDLNSYQKGKLNYQFKSLSSGLHTLTLKAWDVYNNSSEAATEFIVSESATLALDHVLNYPNPFTTHTTFMFEHNRPFVPMDVQIQVFTVSGKLIKTLSDKITPTGFRSDDIEWDGLDDFGDKIGKGVYVYKLRIRTNDGDYADKFEKLVILR